MTQDENGFLDLLYGATVRPEQWIAVMERFADMIGGTSGLLSRFDQTNGAGSGEIARIDPVMPAIYENHFARLNPFTRHKNPRAETWSLNITTDEDRMPKEDFLRTEYYNDFLKGQAIHSILMMRLVLQGSEGSVLNIQRPESRGQFARHDIEIAARFHPHLIRAFNLSQKLALDRAASQGPAVVFERSVHGLFLLDQAARILRLNRAGEALLRDGCDLSVHCGRLTARHAEMAKRLGALVALAATADPERRTGGSMALPSPMRARPLSVTVAPLRTDNVMGILSQPCVLACVTDLDANASLSERKLRELFGLTRAEIRLALALFEGLALREAAAKLGVSANTAGVHLARIFEKTGVNRQSALIGLLMRVTGLGLDDA